MKKLKRSKQNIQLIYLVLFVFSAVLLFIPFIFKISFEQIKSLGLLGVALFNFISSSSLFFPAPGFIATGIGGRLFNPILVALFAAGGSTLGEGVGFIFGYSSKKMTKSQKHILDSIAHLFHHKYTPIVILLFAFIPNPFFDALGIVAGATLFPAKKFFVLVFVGRFLRDLIVASISRSL